MHDAHRAVFRYLSPSLVFMSEKIVNVAENYLIFLSAWKIFKAEGKDLQLLFALRSPSFCFF